MKNNITFDSIVDNTSDFTQEFVATYPKMAKLLSKAYQIDLVLNGNQRFRQYIWTHESGQTSGWLCKLEHCIPQNRNIIPEHILFSKNVGGIINYWVSDVNDNVETFIDANEFTFSLTDTVVGIGGWEKSYREECVRREIEPTDTSNFVTFALEMNGNTTFYDHKTKEIFAYLHDDYSPFEVIPYSDQPLCSIYKYTKVKTFVDFVELLAEQWSEVLVG